MVSEPGWRLTRSRFDRLEGFFFGVRFLEGAERCVSVWATRYNRQQRCLLFRFLIDKEQQIVLCLFLSTKKIGFFGSVFFVVKLINEEDRR